MGLFDKEEKKENVISREVANDHVNAFLNYYGLSTDDMPDKENKKIFNLCIKKMVDAICEGRAKIKEHSDGYPEVEQTLKSGTVMIYGELGGRAKIAMKDCDPDDMYGRIYALVGSLTGIGQTAVEELKSKDMSFVESIGFLFLKV